MSKPRMSSLLLALGLAQGCSQLAKPLVAEEPAARAMTGTRLASFDVDGIGAADDFDAAVAVLARMDADVVALQGVGDTEEEALLELAIGLGYGHVDWALDGPGDRRVALLSRYALTDVVSFSAAELSGDDRANELDAQILQATVATPGAPIRVVVSMTHSRLDDAEAAAFRRLVEASRLGQVASTSTTRTIVLANLGVAREQLPLSPSSFGSSPSSIADDFWLGDDLWNKMWDVGLVHDPFLALSVSGLHHHPGEDASSHIFASSDIEDLLVEPFQSIDGELDFDGELVNLLAASPHRPLVVELDRIEVVHPLINIADAPVGGVTVSEVLANADCQEPAGEWIELFNRTPGPVDLIGLVVEDQVGNHATVESSLVIEPGDWVVLSGIGGNEICGTPSDLELALPSLNNGGDLVVLKAGGQEIDRSLVWTSSMEGFSDQLGQTGWCQEVPTPGLGGHCGEDDPTAPGESDPGQSDPVDCSADIDGDGFNACDDCDDTDADVHPGATEACNGIDDDCSGSVDAIELDSDGDGALDCRDCADAGWWDETRNLTGNALDDEVGWLVRNQKCSSYTWARHRMFTDLDKHNGQVECVYTGRKISVGSSIPHHTDMNTEHSWPQSLGASSNPARCDLHHLFPVDSWHNTIRNSHPFCDVAVEDLTKDLEGGSRYGWNDHGVRCFEPRDEHKGNTARAMLYFAARYNFGLSGDELEMYRAWDLLDPVDGDELDRTWRIADLQDLPNPYVVCRDIAQRR